MSIIQPKIHTSVYLQLSAGPPQRFIVGYKWEPVIPLNGLFQVMDNGGAVHVLNAEKIVYMRVRAFDASLGTVEEA